MNSDVSSTHTVLFVDDEKNVLSALQRSFRRDGYAILLAGTGREALELLEKHNVALVLSDHGMPEMSGVDLLKRVKEKHPDVMRLMLTGLVDPHMVMSAINHGEVFRFVQKPWDDEDLRQVVRSALDQYDLVQENRRLQILTGQQNDELKRINSDLEIRVQERTKEIAEKNAKLDALYKELRRNFFDTIKVFVELMELHYPYLGGHSKRVAEYSKSMAIRFGCDAREVQQIEIAALLHDIGLIGVPGELVEKPVQNLKPDEVALIKQHPLWGQSSLEAITSLRQVGVLIRCHHECYDGKGFPDGLRGEEIPLGSRMISVAEAYDDIMYWTRSPHESPKEAAITHIRQHRSQRFDPRVVDQFLDAVDQVVVTFKEMVVNADQIEEGMVLSRDLRTGSGRLLLPRNTSLKASSIERIKNFHKIDPIVQRIYVCAKLEERGAKPGSLTSSPAGTSQRGT